ncbi:hypothetical protein M9458_048271, partial [Cirrhinus mrigala]
MHKKQSKDKGRGNNGAPQPVTSEIKEGRLVGPHYTPTRAITGDQDVGTVGNPPCRTAYSLAQMSHVEEAKMSALRQVDADLLCNTPWQQRRQQR